MLRYRHTLSALALGFVLAAPHFADGAIISLVTTPFASPSVLETFDDFAIDPFFTITASSGTVFASAASFAGNVTPSGAFGLSTNTFPDPIRVDYASPVGAAGMWFGNDDTCCTPGFIANLDIYGAGLAYLGTVSRVANMNDFADQFIGFTSDTPVYTTVLRYGSGRDVGLYHYIDDLQANIVPEPGSMLLLGSGFAAMVALRRRKN